MSAIFLAPFPQGCEVDARHVLTLMLTVPEVIDVLGIGRNTVYEIIRTGELPSRRIGKRGQIRVLKYDLIRYMEGNL